MGRFLLAGLLTCGLQAQSWRDAMMALPENPQTPPNAAQLASLQQNMGAAMPYFAGLTPRDYEANRAVVRRMATYLLGVQLLTRDPQMQAAISQSYLGLAGFGWAGIPAWGSLRQPVAPATPGAPSAPTTPSFPTKPPFALQAPEVNVAADAQERLIELQSRYESASAKASSTWAAAATISRNLEARGMTLNGTVLTSLARVQLYFDLAASALRAQNWADAETNITRADYETENVRKTTGR